MTVDQVLARLDGVTGGSGQWTARCPAHDDSHASLTISVGRDGRTLLTCWAGCDLDDIVAGVGLSVRDLFASSSDAALQPTNGVFGRALQPALPDLDTLAANADELLRNAGALARIHELKGWRPDVLAALGIGWHNGRLVIPVLDLDGAVVLNVLRYWPELKPKMIATKGFPRSPYYALVDEAAPVWVTEGETDAISLAHLGLNAIGAPGASARPKSEWLEPVRGRDVLVCMDNDDAGRKAANKWAAAAHELAGSVRVVELEGAVSYDVSDLLIEHRSDPGRARAHLYGLAGAAAEYELAAPVIAPRATAAYDGVDESLETGTIISRPLSSFQTQRLRMLWRERIPVGRVGLIYGPPGLGKSTLLAYVVAEVTQAGGRVLVASAEDDPQTTLVPRMAAAGADIGLVDIISTKASKGETSLVLPRDLDQLGERMRGVVLCIIDPFVAHLGDDINSWREQDVRAQVLAPLAYHARLTGCAVPLVMHMNKANGTDAMSRVSGSGGFIGAARFALLLGTHPDDVGLDENERRLALVHVKASESARMPTMVFRRRVAGVQAEDGIAAVPVLEVVDDQAQISPEAVLEHTDPDEAGAFSEALDFLRHELANGAKPSKRLLAQARERGDFSERTLRKAKRALKVASTRESDGWWWTLA